MTVGIVRVEISSPVDVIDGIVKELHRYNHSDLVIMGKYYGVPPIPEKLAKKVYLGSL